MGTEEDRKRARWITTIFFILSGLLSASWFSRIPDVQKGLGLNNTGLGIVLAAVPVGLVTGILFSSWLITRFGTRKVMLASCLLMALFISLLGLVDQRALLMLALFFMGVSRTILNISVNTRSVEVQKLYDRPIISLFHGIWSLACLVAAGLGTVMIIYEVGPGLHLFAVALLCALLALYFGKQDPGGLHMVPERRPFFVMPDRYLLVLGAIAFCIMLCETAMFEWSINFFEKEIGAEKSLVTAGYTAFIIAMSLGRIVGDRIIGRFGPLRILMFNGFLMAMGYAVASFFPAVLPATIGCLLVGLGDSILIPIVYGMAARSKKMQPSYALACVNLIGSTGFIVSPLLIGTLSDQWGMANAFKLLAGLAVGISLLSLMVKKERS